MLDHKLFTTPKKKYYLVRAFNKPPIEIYPNTNRSKKNINTTKMNVYITQIEKILKSYVLRKHVGRFSLSEIDDSLLIQMIRDCDL